MNEQKIWGRVTLALSLVQFLTFLDTTIVAVALSSIQTSLQAGIVQLEWVVGGYALTFASCMFLFGKLGDVLGRRKILIFGGIVFAAGSIIAALAPNPTVLIIARCGMGVGASATEPSTLSIIRQEFIEPSKRAKALGIWAAVAGLSIATGPVIGGVLNGLGGFRALFWFSTALGLMAVVIARAWLSESKDATGMAFDWKGTLCAVSALVLLVIATIFGESQGYGSPEVLGLWVLGIIAGVLFILTERNATDPVVDLSYFKIPSFSASLLISFSAFFAIIATFFFVALYIQLILGYSYFATAVVFIPMAIAMVRSSIFAGTLVAKRGPLLPMTLGSAMTGIGIVLADITLRSVVNEDYLVLSLVVVGLGLGVTVVPATTIALDALPSDKSGMAGATTNTARALGIIAGVSILGSLLHGELTNGLSQKLIAIGVPANFRRIIISAVNSGGLPTGSSGSIGQLEKAYGASVLKVVNAVYVQFHSGLSIALVSAAMLMFVSALASIIGFRMQRRVVGK